MERIRKLYYKETEILSIDYSDLKEDEMMILLTKARDIIVAENKNVRVYNIFNRKNYATPSYMRHLEKELREAEPLIQKNAIIGLSKTQLWILKGINLWYKKKIHHFESQEQALDFLVSSE